MGDGDENSKLHVSEDRHPFANETGLFASDDSTITYPPRTPQDSSETPAPGDSEPSPSVHADEDSQRHSNEDKHPLADEEDVLNSLLDKTVRYLTI